ncbi:uncharacterized protein VNE69_02137 [Vairimorpha necatrix]|uniref:Uncharacterized protein n=1 Tax=Vairimorpha necatrix TaxID=6039 RepID=A0AAX4J9H8_9MICR
MSIILMFLITIFTNESFPNLQSILAETNTYDSQTILQSSVGGKLYIYNKQDKKIYFLEPLFLNLFYCEPREKPRTKFNFQFPFQYSDFEIISRFVYKILVHNKKIKNIIKKLYLTENERKQKKLFNFFKFYEYVNNFTNDDTFIYNVDNSSLFLEVLAYNSANLIHLIYEVGLYKFNKSDFEELKELIDGKISISFKFGCYCEDMRIFNYKKFNKINEKLDKVRARNLRLQLRSDNKIKNFFNNSGIEDYDVINQENYNYVKNIYAGVPISLN